MGVYYISEIPIFGVETVSYPFTPDSYGTGIREEAASMSLVANQGKYFITTVRYNNLDISLLRSFVELINLYLRYCNNLDIVVYLYFNDFINLVSNFNFWIMFVLCRQVMNLLNLWTYSFHCCIFSLSQIYILFTVFC